MQFIKIKDAKGQPLRVNIHNILFYLPDPVIVNSFEVMFINGVVLKCSGSIRALDAQLELDETLIES